jgi:hypothetical protein
MALKPDRFIIQEDVAFRLRDVAAKGKFLVFGSGNAVATNVNAGSGVAMDSPYGFVALVSNPSGFVPAGCLMNNFVNIDTSLYHINYYKDEHVIGDKCTLLRKGWVVTNCVTGTPKTGDGAYLTSNGEVTPTNTGSVQTPQVGQFLSAKDENGYAKVQINL